MTKTRPSFSAPYRRLIQAALSLALAVPIAGFAQDAPQLNLQRTTLGAGMYQISAQLALTPEQRQTGLMFRKEMPQQEGMLFVFEQVAQQCFWMRNTFLPLTGADKALLTVDVWEHAYYIDYRNQRPKFVETFLSNLVNWQFAEANFA